MRSSLFYTYEIKLDIEEVIPDTFQAGSQESFDEKKEETTCDWTCRWDDARAPPTGQGQVEAEQDLRETRLP